MKINHQKTKSTSSISSTKKDGGEQKKLDLADEKAVYTITKHMGGALQIARARDFNNTVETEHRTIEADRSNAATPAAGTTSEILDTSTLPETQEAGEDTYKKIDKTGLYYLESGPGVQRMQATLNLATDIKATGGGYSFIGTSLVYEGLENAYKNIAMGESQKNLIASTMNVIKENTTHTIAFSRWQKDEGEAIKIISANSKHSPQLINTGYIGHTISAVLYKKELYIANRGALSNRPDPLNKNFKNDNQLADIPSTHPTLKLRDESQVEEVLSKLIRAKQITKKNEAIVHWNEIYNQFDDATIKHTKNELNSNLNDLTPDIWADQGRDRGKPIKIKIQAGGNCAYSSPQLATRAIMNILGRELGMPPKLINDTYKKSISNSAMRERYIAEYIKYRTTNTPNYNYKEDAYLSLTKKGSINSKTEWYDQRVDKRLETINEIQKKITGAENPKTQKNSFIANIERTSSDEGKKILTKSSPKAAKVTSIIEDPNTNPAKNQQGSISSNHQRKTPPELIGSTSASATESAMSTATQMKDFNRLAAMTEEADDSLRDNDFSYNTDDTDYKIKNWPQKSNYNGNERLIKATNYPRTEAIENNFSAEKEATIKTIGKHESGAKNLIKSPITTNESKSTIIKNYQNGDKKISSKTFNPKSPDNLIEEPRWTDDDGNYHYQVTNKDDNDNLHIQKSPYRNDEPISFKNNGDSDGKNFSTLQYKYENNIYIKTSKTSSGGKREERFRIDDKKPVSTTEYDASGAITRDVKYQGGGIISNIYTSKGSTTQKYSYKGKYSAGDLFLDEELEKNLSGTITKSTKYANGGTHSVTLHNFDGSGQNKVINYGPTGNIIGEYTHQQGDKSNIISKKIYTNIGYELTSYHDDYEIRSTYRDASHIGEASPQDSVVSLNDGRKFHVFKGGEISGIDWKEDIDPTLLDAFSTATDEFRPKNVSANGDGVNEFYQNSPKESQCLMIFCDQIASLGIPFYSVRDLNVGTYEDFQKVHIDTSPEMVAQWKSNANNMPDALFLEGGKSSFLADIDSLANGAGAKGFYWQMTGLVKHFNTIDNIMTLGTFYDLYDLGKGFFKSTRGVTKCLYGLGFLGAAAGLGFGIYSSAKWFTDTATGVEGYFSGVDAAEASEKAYVALSALGGPPAGIAAAVDAKEKGATPGQCFKAFFAGCIGLYDPLNPRGVKSGEAPPVSSSSLGLGCWVAREVYGENNPRWLVFREWLVNEAPTWFRDLYFIYGSQFANFIKDKPWLKIKIKAWMDTKIDPRLDFYAPKYLRLLARYQCEKSSLLSLNL